MLWHLVDDSGAVVRRLLIGLLVASLCTGLLVATEAPRPAAATPGSDYEFSVLADGPTNFWKLSESSGSSADDSAGGNDGSIASSGVTLGASGPMFGASAFAFDNACHGVTLPTTVFRRDDFSLELWLKTSANGVVFTSLYHGWALVVEDGKLVLSAARNAFDREVVTGSTSIADGEWHHVVASRNPSKSSTLYPGTRALELTVDGAVEGRQWATNYLSGTYWSTGIAVDP